MAAPPAAMFSEGRRLPFAGAWQAGHPGALRATARFVSGSLREQRSLSGRQRRPHLQPWRAPLCADGQPDGFCGQPDLNSRVTDGRHPAMEQCLLTWNRQRCADFAVHLWPERAGLMADRHPATCAARNIADHWESMRRAGRVYPYACPTAPPKPDGLMLLDHSNPVRKSIFGRSNAITFSNPSGGNKTP